MTLVYDATLMRPACPILQAVLGGDEGLSRYFSPDSWLVEPTPDMKAYLVTQEQLFELGRRSYRASS